MAIFLQIRKSLPKTLLCITLLSLMFFFPSTAYASNQSPETSVSQESKEVTRGIVWYHKYENGNHYMRAYDTIQQIWVTDWIYVGPA